MGSLPTADTIWAARTICFPDSRQFGPPLFRSGNKMTEKKKVFLTKAALLKLYAARRFLDGSVQEELSLKLSFDVYFQDPLFAKEHPEMAFDAALVPWEPGLAAGPTSARFAVVDFNGDTEALIPPSAWNEDQKHFCDSSG